MDCLLLGLEGCQYVVGVILNDEVGNRTSVQPPFDRGSTNTFDTLQSPDSGADVRPDFNWISRHDPLPLSKG